MHWKRLLVLLVLLFVAACAQDDDEEPATATVEVETPQATATTRPTPTPSPTATATATPMPQPEVEALEQAVDEDGQFVVSSVFALQDGWLVVYADDEGAPGEVLGHVPIEAGESSDVVVPLDAFSLTPVLHVRLHEDTGQAGEFEYPQADEPLEVDGEVVGAAVDVDVRVVVPALAVADQTLGQDGQVVVDSVTAAAPGWVAVHADDEGDPGHMLGLSPVQAGETDDVVVRFNWRETTRRLHAVLYADNGEQGLFEEEEDTPVTIAGEPIAASFIVEAPPDVYVINQPVVAPEIVVERAFINAPGWIAVFSNFEGFTDRLLGVAPLEAGENTMITVPIEPSNTTDILHVLLHEDVGVEGQFDYPADDPPLRGEDDRPLFFSFETDTGNYVVTRDQTLGEEGTLEVPLVVTDLATWVTVWTDEEGQRGDIIGQTLVERGVQRDVAVEIDAEAATETLHVVLHQDAGELGEFEYPGPDEILLREREVISAPVVLETGD